MSKGKMYQLWVHFVEQSAEHPRSANEFCLAMETDNDLGMFFVKKYELEQEGNIVLVTKRLTLSVKLSDQPNTQQEG